MADAVATVLWNEYIYKLVLGQTGKRDRMLKLEEENRVPDLETFCISGELALSGQLHSIDGPAKQHLGKASPLPRDIRCGSFLE